MITNRNHTLKAEIIGQGWKLTDFALELRKAGLKSMDLWTLSSIIAGRRRVRDEEKRLIAWKLQKPIKDLFP